MNSLKTVIKLLLASMMLAAGSTIAMADWREDMGRFRIGVAQAQPSEDTMLELEPFRLAMEEKLGLTVEMVTFSSLARLARAHAGGRLEYAVYPATTYAATWTNCECIEPLAVAAAGDGTIEAHSVLITRRSAGIRSPADLSGKKVWLLTKDGILTHRYAIHAMASESSVFDEDAVTWLTDENPRAAIEKFINGEGDAMIGWSSLQGDATQGYSRGTPNLVAQQVGDFSKFAISWQSPPLAHHVHSVLKKIDGEAKKILRETLNGISETDPVAYDSIEPVYEGGLQTVPHSMFSSAIGFVESLLPQDTENEELPIDQLQGTVGGIEQPWSEEQPESR